MQKKGNKNKKQNSILIKNQEILSQKTTLIKEFDNLLEKAVNMENNVSALINCRKIQEIQKINNIKSSKKDYSQLFQSLCQDLKNENQIIYDYEVQYQENIRNLEGIINIEKDIAPEIDEISIENLKINDFELNLMMDRANDLLDNIRVKLKHEITSTAVLISKQGKAFPSKQNNKIRIKFPLLEDSSLAQNPPLEIIAETEYNLTLFSKDPIEEAFIEDIIPYNYEVKEIEINDKIPMKSPQKHFSKDGMKLGWKLENLHDNDSISIRYHLRPRVSRTIIIPQKENVKVIRTHSNLKDNQKQKGLYTTSLLFNNNYNEKLKRVVMEDLIPRSYSYEVEEKKSDFFPSSKEVAESFVKWKIFDVPFLQSTEHEYSLTELNTLEEMKLEAYKILQENESGLNYQEKYYLHKKKVEAKRFLDKFKHK